MTKNCSNYCIGLVPKWSENQVFLPKFMDEAFGDKLEIFEIEVIHV